MAPNFTPVYVTPGGYFLFTGILQNNTELNRNVDVAIYVRMPGGSLYGPLEQFFNIPIAPYQIMSYQNVRQNIPGYALLGDYQYVAYCGDFPSNPYSSSEFDFTIMSPIAENSNSWELSNWFDEDIEVIPEDNKLIGNYPNPFNNSTSIEYALRSATHVTLDIYNLAGQKIETIVNETQNRGTYSIQWDASRYSSGVYFYKLVTNDQVLTKRMILLK